MKVHGEFKVNALTLERVLKHNYRKAISHNRIHMVLKEAGRAVPQPSKQRRRRWVRYERQHSSARLWLKSTRLWSSVKLRGSPSLSADSMW